MSIKQIKKIKLGEETYSIAVENILNKVDTIDNIPNSELNLYRYDKEGVSSPVVEVVSEYHEGGESNVFAKSTTANNNKLTTVTAFTGHFDATLSNFVTVDSISGDVYTYNNNYPMNGIRLGTKTAIGYINVTLLQDGALTFHRYFGFNGSTGEITSYDASASVVIDGKTYNFTADDEDLVIPVSAGTHTIENVNGRILFLSFVFGGEAYYTYEKKHLARQEDIETTILDWENSFNDLEAKVTTNEKAIQKNTQDISTVDSKIGSVQIYDVLKSLPKASMNHLDEIYRLDKKLYQCVQKGDGVHKDFAFNLSGESEILDSHLESLYPTIAKDFTEYLEFDLESSSKVFRNNGSIKLGSSKATGELWLTIAEDFILNKPLRALKVGVKAYNKDKSTITIRLNSSSSEGEASYLIEDFTNETLLDLSHLNIFKSAIELDYADNSDEIESIVITTSDRYVKYIEEDYEITYTDNRGCITRIIADFGDIIYEWEGVGGSDPLVKITYNELKDLRDNSQLVPGQQYRITDYVTTTSQINTRSAGHRFDIIVTADDEKTLNENARAIKSEVEIPTWKAGITAEDIQILFRVTDGAEHYDLNNPDEFSESKSVWELTEINGLPAFYDIDPETEGIGVAYIYGGIQEFDGEIYDLWWETTSEDGKTFGRLTNKVVNSGYFDNSTLESWEIKYCLDNDTERFAWAVNNKGYLYGVSSSFADVGEPLMRCFNFDYPNFENSEERPDMADYKYAWGTQADIDDDDPTNFVYTKTTVVDTNDLVYSYAFPGDFSSGAYTKGKGVIYYMKDEYNNEAPYDFKNIQFIRKLNHSGHFNPNDTDSTDTWCYTFGGTLDRSIIQPQYGRRVYFNNSVELSYFGCQGNELSNNVFVSTNECVSKNNKISINSCNNTFGDKCSNNILGPLCCNNWMGSNCEYNILASECHYNYFYSSCTTNKLGQYNDNNSFGVDCCYNTFGSYCSYNELDDSCSNNTFEDSVSSNRFGWECCANNLKYNCENNTFGNNCTNNTLGYSCSDNTLEAYCTNNSFGQFCADNSLGENCIINIFGDDCHYNTLGYGCSGNLFAETCCNNTIGINCVGNIFEFCCTYNMLVEEVGASKFGEFCFDNYIGNMSLGNTFGCSCQTNKIEAYSNYNSFSNDCSYNVIGEECGYNSFENNCTYNNITSNSINNVIRHHSSYINIAQYCENNIVGSCNTHNSIGESSYNITFGDNCIGNTLGSSCWSNITFESNVNYTKLQKPTDALAELVYNITVANGVAGESTGNPKIITVTKEPEDKTPIIYKAANTTEIILD